MSVLNSCSFYVDRENGIFISDFLDVCYYDFWGDWIGCLCDVFF